MVANEDLFVAGLTLADGSAAVIRYGTFQIGGEL